MIDAGGGKVINLIGFHKITAVIAEHGGFNDDNAGNLGLDKIEFSHDIVFSFFKTHSMDIKSQVYCTLFGSISQEGHLAAGPQICYNGKNISRAPGGLRPEIFCFVCNTEGVFPSLLMKDRVIG